MRIAIDLDDNVQSGRAYHADSFNVGVCDQNA